MNKGRDSTVVRSDSPVELRNAKRLWRVRVWLLYVSMTTAIASAQVTPAIKSCQTESLMTAKLTILVTDPTGTGIPNSAMILEAARGGTLCDGKTDQNGTWSLRGVVPGTYKLQIAAPGFQTGNIEVKVIAPATSARQALKIGACGSPIIEDPSLQLHTSLVQIDPLPLIPQARSRKR